ncbi:PEP-CTERM sorting domain-containing protein [Vibrio sp. B1FLJ16]|uniref:PEP-CTERM sorting domain-containing protein n=1 Tax=Vibrio sp. B1FLJ16 TaxID=2751178 RepID=UPI0015F3AAE2|nr:PEP-CTERM sorting domain-containing protein [Vibrio sp. B1FLJ16]CAD7816901.1 hypothetical protein ACOMICROBIO_EPCKBFOG_03076 [Vibrio sp. B1FLJ16]CAD7818085.1 hypothetical protein ACOMICROBIO_FLGHMIGD_03606 [Vibrio sp. B1FLJ16]CAE6929573.1 hypothetical protein ACOMICROBIO_EPCKBFOG_03076 [Vibrio sp. B1FLJ16]CAE6933271.1 hypothetical protein ACOMICROBIO_FLGHMIGD_03606 [Vibrio sp. B1FLJ16]
MKLVKTLAVMACGLLLHANAQADEILIDDFSTLQGPVSDLVVGGGGASNQISSVGGDILGGYRDIYVEEVDNGIDTGDDASLGIHVQVSNGRFSATLDDLVKGYAVITYDGANEVGSNWEGNVDTNGLGSQDWSDTAYFSFEEISNDIIAPVQLIVWTNDNEDGVTFVKHIADLTTDGDINDGGLYDSQTSLSEFADAGSINWASVGAFQAVFNLDSTGNLDNSEISVDLSLSRAVLVTEVPEPAALSMFGAGMLMLGFVGYRRRKNQ